MVYETATHLKDISSRIDVILEKINEKEPTVIIKATSTEPEFYLTPVKIRL